MFPTWLFGGSGEGPKEPEIPEGHRAILVAADGQRLRVDVDALAEASGLFLQVKSTNADECPLDDFPGGFSVLRQIVDLLSLPPGEESARRAGCFLEVSDENVLSLLEAAWLLECPKVFDEVMDSAYMTSLSSRHAAELLEHILPFTTVTSPSEGVGPFVAQPSCTIGGVVSASLGDAAEAAGVSSVRSRGNKGIVRAESGLDGEVVLGSDGKTSPPCEADAAAVDRSGDGGAEDVGAVAKVVAQTVAEEQPPRGKDSDELVASQMEDFLRIFTLETAMWQRTERAALELATQLDSSDFLLGPRLATGSMRVCLELLALHQQREEEAGFLSSALRPVSSMWKSLVEKPPVRTRSSIAWDRHQFALQCMRKRLKLGTATSAAVSTATGSVSALADVGGSGSRFGNSQPQGAAAAGTNSELEEEAEARTDISSTICSSATDAVLSGFTDYLQYVEFNQLQPNWKALMIRVVLLSGSTSRARDLFREAFAESDASRALVPEIVPVAWLADVADHEEASRVLLRVLADYPRMPGEAVCDAVEGVLLAKLLPSPHCSRLVLPSRLLDGLVGACFAAGQKAEAAARGETLEGPAASRCPAPWTGQHLLARLRHAGGRLFEAAFVAQRGFLPHEFPPSSLPEASDPVTVDVAIDVGFAAAVSAELPHCSAEPLVLKIPGSCLWDEGLLHLDLLRPIMNMAVHTPQDPTLHFGRQVIMRHLWWSLARAAAANTTSVVPPPSSALVDCPETGESEGKPLYCVVWRLTEYWDMACWPLCEDARLIREALEYLKGVARELRGGARRHAWSPELEEALFRMFAALDLSRLPGQVLLSPWVPSQAHTLRLYVHEQPAERLLSELERRAKASSKDLSEVSAQCAALATQLSVVEQRTIVTKSQIHDAIAVLEERNRRRCGLSAAASALSRSSGLIPGGGSGRSLVAGGLEAAAVALTGPRELAGHIADSP